MATCFKPIKVRVADPKVCQDCDEYCILANPDKSYECVDLDGCRHLLSLMGMSKSTPLCMVTCNSEVYKTTMVEIADREICKRCDKFRLQAETLFDDGDRPQQHYACANLDECQRKIARFREAGIT